MMTDKNKCTHTESSHGSLNTLVGIPRAVRQIITLSILKVRRLLSYCR